ncbi:thiamine pyrophosphokinase [Oleoguttula sp. CCFEE 5521]
MADSKQEKGSNPEDRRIELWPTRFLHSPWAKATASLPVPAEIALIILNSPLIDYETFKRLYSRASTVVCADGGANRLYNLLTSTFPDHAWDTALRKHLPSLIHGDLDSLTANVRSCYEELGVPVSKDPDQYSTDFGKGINQISFLQPDVRDILVLGSLGGRVDQGIGLLHELYREQVTRHPDVRFWLFSESSITFMLQPGTTVIRLPRDTGLVGRNVGLLPVYGKAVIGTKGLEWDVQDWETEMGGMMSTSNHVLEDDVEITCDREVLFTVERGDAK